MTRLMAIVAWIQATRPVRAMQHYSSNAGAVMASGMAYMALFSTFAALWVFFSVAGLVFASMPDLLDQVTNFLSTQVPGLIGEGGLIAPSQLSQAGVFGWTGAIALVGSLWTAIGWLGGTRTAIRTLFGVPVPTGTPFAIEKLRDVGFIIVLAIAMIVSVALSVGTTGLLRTLLDLVGVDGTGTYWTLRIIGLALVAVFDAVIIAAILRVLSSLRIPRRYLATASMTGGIAVVIVTQLGSALLGGASANPFVASFAVLVGVLLFFNLLCTILLVCASWVKVVMDDTGASPRLLTAGQARTEAAEAELLARRERLAAERIILRDRLDHRPRFLRSGTRRRLERVEAEQRRLERLDWERRTGMIDAAEELRLDGRRGRVRVRRRDLRRGDRA